MREPLLRPFSEMRRRFDTKAMVQGWLDAEAALAAADAEVGVIHTAAGEPIIREAHADPARRFRDTPMPGRTHGQRAVPMTFLASRSPGGSTGWAARSRRPAGSRVRLSTGGDRRVPRTSLCCRTFRLAGCRRRASRRGTYPPSESGGRPHRLEPERPGHLVTDDRQALVDTHARLGEYLVGAGGERDVHAGASGAVGLAAGAADVG
jgi:Lyase